MVKFVVKDPVRQLDGATTVLNVTVADSDADNTATLNLKTYPVDRAWACGPPAGSISRLLTGSESHTATVTASS